MSQVDEVPTSPVATLVELLERERAQGAADERERCIHAACSYCRAGIPLAEKAPEAARNQWIGNARWHADGDNSGWCGASSIHALPVEDRGAKMIRFDLGYAEIEALPNGPEKALQYAVSGLLAQGAHHKQWCLEQVIQALGEDLNEIGSELAPEYELEAGCPP